jgi:glyoxylase-like metal-dependent hydrolase (beta-lactamase superfamily II)
VSEAAHAAEDTPPDWTAPGAFAVSPGVHRIPLPLPNDALRAVNVYAIEDGDGLVLIDSGWALDAAHRALDQALGSIGHDLDAVHRFLITHVHRDHYTLGVTLRRLFGSRIALGRGEQPSIERILSREDRFPQSYAPMLRRRGAQAVAERLAALAGTDRVEVDWEAPDEWLDGTDLALASRVLHVVPTPGHTRGHVVFADAAAGVLFAGDHVLPHITPSIGFEPLAGEGRPLGDYLRSLELVRGLPDARLLPAHGPVTASVHERVAELLDHHDRRLDHTEQVVQREPMTAYDAALLLPWTRRERAFSELDPFNQMLAVNETAAHLDVLVDRGRLHATEVDGVVVYAATSGSP